MRRRRALLSEQDPELTRKFGPLDFRDASSNELMRGGRMNVSTYQTTRNPTLPAIFQGDLDRKDIEKSKKMREYLEMAGPGAERKLAGEWQGKVWEEIAGGNINRYTTGPTNMQQVQDMFMANMEKNMSPEELEERRQKEAMTLRDAYARR